MNSNRIYMFKILCVLVLVAALFGIYVLANPQSLTGSALVHRNKKKQTEHLARPDLPCSSVIGTVLDVTGQTVIVQGDDRPCTICLVYVNGDLPTGLAPGKTVIMSGKFRKGFFVSDNITITGVTPWTALETSPQSLGLIDGMIFFIAYWLL